MDVWSPAQYRRFAAERRQPFDALVALCEPSRSGLAYDLGCGPGELTRELPRRLGVARVVGVDSSDAMLQSAAEHADESVSFQQGDLATFVSPTPVDVMFSNAALHWVPDHAAVLAHWRAQLAPGGQLAVQLPLQRRPPGLPGHRHHGGRAARAVLGAAAQRGLRRERGDGGALRGDPARPRRQPAERAPARVPARARGAARGHRVGARHGAASHPRCAE
ncbi:MAG: methyltransferase domain-containing protein [Sandaracinaceae bacterium]|nr:methyltransferase domain-containing protein [Sandaracinaceae bacterium]